MADQYQMGIKVPTITQVTPPGGGPGYIPTWTPAGAATPTETAAEDKPPVVPGEDPRVTAAKIAAKAQQDAADAETSRRRAATSAAVKNAFDMYGLSALYPLIEQYAQQGLTEDAIYMNLRQTEAYKNRFPAMAELSKTGRAITEAAYIDYERKAAQMEQMYGLPKGMVMGQVTDLLVGDVSAVELQDRIVLASADSLTAPEDLKQQINAYYGVNGDEALRGYYLDPDVALPILQKQSASARIGVQAVRAGVQGVQRTLAEELQGLGVSESDAQKGFVRVAGQSGLSAGTGDTASQDVLIDANLKQSAAAQDAVTRSASARVNRFEGGGAFAGDRKGTAGIGSASS